MDEMERRNKILLVDPESNCRLIDPDNGAVSWLIEFNKPLVYQYHEPTAKDYLTIAGSEHGKMELFRNRKYTKGEEVSSEIIYCPTQEDIQVLLKSEFGEKCVTTSETIYLDGTTGDIHHESDDSSFLIERNSYEMKLYTSRHSESRLSWQLNYTSFTASYPLVNQELRDPIRVFHTVNQHDFYRFCRDFEVKNPFGSPLLKTFKWKLPKYEEKIRIQLFESYVPNSNMRCGSYLGVAVGVEKLKAEGDFSKRVKLLTHLGAHENILDLIAAETDGIDDTFAYQMTFTSSMKDHLLMLGNGLSRTDSNWIKVFRGIICGLRFLHTHKMRHGKLNMENVFVKENYTAKLAGLANIELLSYEEKRDDLTEYLSMDIFDFGKLLLNVMTDGKHGGDPRWGKDGGDATWEKELEDILETFEPEDEEVKDLLRKVLKKNYKDRPTLQQILEHPFFCDLPSRIDLLSQLSDFCEAMKLREKKYSKRLGRNHGVHRVVFELDIVIGPKLFGPGLSWEHIFDNEDALQKAMKHRTKAYDFTILTDLVRIFRKIMSHHDEYKEKFKVSLGITKSDTESIFRRKFPEYFMSIHEVAKRRLDQKFRSLFKITDPDFTFLETIPSSVCSRL